MCKIFLSIYFLIFCLFAEAHSGKARFHIIIDTDGGADDLRAICMLLGNREVETLAITASEGALKPADAALKVTALLNYFHHEGIPVGTGRLIGITPPAWRGQSEQINWGDAANAAAPKQTAKDLMTQTLENEEEKVILICLGTLTNLADALAAKPQLKKRIDRVLWYNNSVKPLAGENYNADRKSVDNVLASGIPVEVISITGGLPFEAISFDGRNAYTIDQQYLDNIARIDNIYAKHIVSTHSSGVLAPVVADNHLKAWDDMVVVRLFAPELFVAEKINASTTLCILPDDQAVAQAMLMISKILTGKPDTESRVFYGFPEEPGLYAADISPVMKGVIARHGRSEWRAGVLTNELHGHLGIYAIIGVKMGIRAREYFNIGVDDVVVVSYAGLQPPVSCMNDGLQVSTGGTLGHGLISVASGEPVRPETSFTFKNKTLRLKLKPAYAQQIRKDVEEAIRQHGNLTEPYWQQIRLLAIKYWGEFDRHEMFEMKLL